MLILGLIGMYFDAVMVLVASQTLLFRLALAIHSGCFGKFLSKKYLTQISLLGTNE